MAALRRTKPAETVFNLRSHQYNRIGWYVTQFSYNVSDDT